jgi:hypothetical protein
MGGDSLPGCIGHYGMQQHCKGCAWVDVCKGLIAKDRLKPLASAILECKSILKEGKQF